ncbi:MAG: hypothetical protein ACC650_03260 [Gammaproteobacteria bacterium]
MLQRKLQIYLIIFTVALLLFLSAERNLFAAEHPSSVGLTNYSFASYLGTGFYTTSGQKVFVLQLPLDYTIKPITDTEAGVLLKLPLTIGFINFENIDIEQLPDANDLTTLTFLPGIEYQYPVTPDWTVAPFADYGFARDFNNDENVLIVGAGVKSYLDFHFEDSMLTLGNRYLYARERSQSTANDSDYSMIETGLNYRMTSIYSYENGPLYSNLYYINFYYPNNLVFFERTPNPIRVGIEHEIGITFSNMPDFLFFEKPQLGLGVRFGNNINVYRIIFGAPF